MAPLLQTNLIYVRYTSYCICMYIPLRLFLELSVVEVWSDILHRPWKLRSKLHQSPALLCTIALLAAGFPRHQRLCRLKPALQLAGWFLPSQSSFLICPVYIRSCSSPSSICFHKRACGLRASYSLSCTWSASSNMAIISSCLGLKVPKPLQESQFRVSHSLSTASFLKMPEGMALLQVPYLWIV